MIFRALSQFVLFFLQTQAITSRLDSYIYIMTVRNWHKSWIRIRPRNLLGIKLIYFSAWSYSWIRKSDRKTLMSINWNSFNKPLKSAKSHDANIMGLIIFSNRKQLCKFGRNISVIGWLAFDLICDQDLLQISQKLSPQFLGYISGLNYKCLQKALKSAI